MQPTTPRVVMIGDSSVGKTSLVYQLCKNEHNTNPRPTVATTFYTLEGDPNKGEMSVQIWDTAGAERYRALNSVYYHNAMGGILVFDLTSRASFQSLDSWLDDFKNLAQPNALLVIVGNKLDIYNDAEERVKIDEAEKWAKEHGFRYFSTSAQDGTGVQDVKEYVLANVHQESVTFHPSVDITKPRAGNGKDDKKGCCA